MARDYKIQVLNWINEISAFQITLITNAISVDFVWQSILSDVVTFENLRRYIYMAVRSSGSNWRRG